MVKGWAVDFLFWIGVVGNACDEGRGTTEEIVADLLRLTSLTDSEAREVIAEMEKAGKLVSEDGKYRCTIPK